MLLAFAGMRALKRYLIENGYGPSIANGALDGDESESEESDDEVESKIWELDSDNEVGDNDAPKSKRTKLLSPSIGITDTNWLISSYMVPLLGMYGDLCTRAQTTTQPIGHKMARQVELFFERVTDAFITGSPLMPDCFDAPDADEDGLVRMSFLDL